MQRIGNNRVMTSLVPSAIRVYDKEFTTTSATDPPDKVMRILRFQRKKDTEVEVDILAVFIRVTEKKCMKK